MDPATGGFWSNLFSTDFVPRAQCVGDRPEIIALHTISDAAIALAYYSIPIALVVFLRRRRDLAFPHIFWLFAGFILACGTTHVLSIAAFWHPMYRLDGVVKAGTGLISVVTAGVLWPLIPKALALPSQSQLREANRALEAEVVSRRDAQSRLDAANEDLERRVADRTAELQAAAGSLEAARRTAERKLAELEAVYAATPAGLCFFDARATVLRVNRTFAGLFRIRMDELLGRPLSELEAVLGPRLHGAVARAATVAEPAVDLALSLADPPRHVLATVRPARSHAGDLLGVSIIVHDTTERDQLHDQLRQSQKSEAIGQLASGIAHEINNALTAIYGYLSLGRAAIESAHPAANYLDQILVAAHQASSVTKSLLTFARREPARREPVDLHEAVDRASTLLHGLLPATIRLHVDTAAVQGVSVLGDTNQLQQVVLNLAINARDAMPTGGDLTIRLDHAMEPIAGVADLDGQARPAPSGRPAVRLTVADTGIGMPAEVVQRVFEPFFTTKPRGQGTGLGLSVVQGIVRAHGGDIRIRSEVGRGTTVEIDLPTETGAHGVEPPPADAAAEGVTGPPATPAERAAGTVVLAEDNRAIRQMFATALRQRGIPVVEAADGFELMDQMAALAAVGTPILALILDIDMPGRSGTECLQLLRERGDRSPAIIISGGPMAVPANLNAHCLPKPFTSADLVKALQRAVKQPL